MSDEVTALQNEVASLRKLLEIARRDVEANAQYERRDAAQRELTYQKIIGLLLDRLAEEVAGRALDEP